MQLMSLLSVLLVNLNSENFPVLSLAAIIGGLAINTILFPFMILNDYFPGQEAVVSGLGLACSCLSCTIAPIMLLIWKNYPSLTLASIWRFYGFVIMLPVIVLFIMVMPWNRTSAISNKQQKQSESHDVSNLVAEAGSGSLVQAILSIEFLCIFIVNLNLMAFVSHPFLFSYFFIHSSIRPHTIKLFWGRWLA